MLSLAAPALASTTCFDFDRKVTASLGPEIPASPSLDGESGQHGALPSGGSWAAVRGEVRKPIAEVLKGLYDPMITKGENVEKQDFVDLPSPDYLARHKISYKVNPFPLISIEWQEDWAYALTRGTRKEPEAVTISYQKTAGTSHIDRLCGNIVLRKKGPATTEVLLYEEAKATRRSPEDTERGLSGTLRTLRERL